nr:MAG TPA: hypothetical protein [Bacteriophage sp.]
MTNNYFAKFTNKGIPFMDGRTKGNISSLVGEVLHIADFGFINQEDSTYPVIAFVEHPTEFYFGGAVLSDILIQVDRDGMREELKLQPITLKMVQSKRGRTYMSVEFIED